MKVSTKVICGLGILMLLAFAALGYQVSVIQQMQSINRDLSAINFQSAFITLNLSQLSATIKEFSQKYFVAYDPIYDRQLEEMRKEFGEDIHDLRKNVRTDRERMAVEQLSQAIDGYWQIFSHVKKENQGKELDYLPPSLTIAMDHLQAQAEVTYDAVKVSIRDEVTRAAEAGQRAERLSRIAEFVALAVGALVLW